jgi:hypothetical protein
VRAAPCHAGKALGSSAAVPVDSKGQPDRKRLAVTGDFRLGTQLAAGDYTLQLTAFESNASGRVATTTQSVDFEVIE